MGDLYQSIIRVWRTYAYVSQTYTAQPHLSIMFRHAMSAMACSKSAIQKIIIRYKPATSGPLLM